MSTDGATLTDIESGKDERLVSKNSYRGVLFDMDKSTFVDAMCVDPPEEMGGDDKALCDRLEKYLQNMKETGCSGINRADAVAYLENEKSWKPRWMSWVKLIRSLKTSELPDVRSLMLIIWRSHV